MQVLAASLKGVTVRYSSSSESVMALDHLDVDFLKGTSTAIVGRSGSGKSTLVSVLGLLRKPTEGDVVVGGVNTSKLAAEDAAKLRSDQIGIVFQAFHLENSLSAADNVMLSWYFRSNSRRRGVAHDRAKSLLDVMGIGDLAARHPNQMSGGQRQRVAIARALFPSPALFIADEPTGNLDEATANEVATVILSLPEAVATTVIVVTHDRVVASNADRQLTLAKGRVDE